LLSCDPADHSCVTRRLLAIAGPLVDDEGDCTDVAEAMRLSVVPVIDLD